MQIPFPRLADDSGRLIGEALESYRREAAIVDARLARPVTIQQKATALSDLCERLRADSGIHLSAGASVADEKVTVLCQKRPLREVMRQLSRPFGYTWLRTRRPALGSGLWALGSGPGTGGRPRTEGPRGSPGSSRSEPRAQSPEPRADYSYELVQDLRSQLLEEELRNRDRREALLALDRDLQRYRPLLGLTPDQALARSRTASGAEKAMLEMLAWPGWAGIQIYFRLSAPELADLREGRAVTYSGAPRSGERPLPADVGRGILQTMRDRHLIREGEHYTYTPDATAPGAVIPPDLPDARGRVRLAITQSEVGQFTLNAQVQYFTLFQGEPDYTGGGERNCGTGMSTDTLQPNNRQTNAALAGDPGLRRPVTVQPVGSRQLAVGSEGERPHLPTASKVTTADVLEALHRATGRPIVGDFYTRLYKPEAVSARNLPLFDALNQLGDATRLRWRQDGAWLQLRTTNYYDERLKEVPNRLLSRWAEARRRQGMLSIEEVVEIAQLSDAQLDAADMAEGAREWWGLAEWDLARQQLVRPHLRFLAGFTPAQRQEAMGATGILFSRMTLAQQQRYLALGLTGGPLQSLEDLDGATLRVEYTQPGWFQWGESGWSSRYTRWVVPLGFTRQDRRVPRPPVRERTREATLQAVRRVDPQLRKALLEAACRTDERLPSAPHVVEEDQVVPTTLDLAFIYIPGSTNARSLWELHPDTCGQVGGFDQ